MIKIATKNIEESQNNEVTRIRHKNRKEFWNLFKFTLILPAIHHKQG